MGLALDDLDDTTRKFMLAELDHDIANGTLLLSRRFTARGDSQYPEIMRAAVTSGSDDRLAAALAAPGLFAQYETRIRSGKATMAAVPHTAPVTFAEGEFNRLYLRGLCARLMEEGRGQVEVYRARASATPRPTSEDLIGRHFDPAALLADLRQNGGVDTALGLPPGPNSGLSGRRTDQ